MNQNENQSLIVCEACRTKPWPEQWQNAGLVLVCECGDWQSVKTNSTLPTEWQQ